MSSQSVKRGTWYRQLQNNVAFRTVITIPHNLGRMPDQVVVLLECVISQLGWSVGDRIPLASIASNLNQGVVIGYDATNVTIIVTNEVWTYNKANVAVWTAITPANWRFVTQVK